MDLNEKIELMQALNISCNVLAHKGELPANHIVIDHVMTVSLPLIRATKSHYDQETEKETAVTTEDDPDKHKGTLLKM